MGPHTFPCPFHPTSRSPDFCIALSVSSTQHPCLHFRDEDVKAPKLPRGKHRGRAELPVWQVETPSSREEKQSEHQSSCVLTTGFPLPDQAARPQPVGSREELQLPGVGPDWTDPESGLSTSRPLQIHAGVGPSAVGPPDADGSAVFRGCFRRPDNLSLALPVTAAMPNMSVDKCVDLCTEKEYPLAALAGNACHCGFPTTRFPLHEREDEQLCAQKCSAEEFESCGTPSYFIVYQTQVQDNRCMDRKFLPAKSKQLIALASFPGAGNTWARHLIELATGFYTGSYYFDGSLYNKGFKGERDHWRSGRTICIKTHESGQKEIEAFDAAILLIRNPYKALMAEFNRKYGGHIGFAAHAHWKGKEWPEFVRNYAPWWATHTLDWLKFGKKVLVVHFEDLKQDLFVQLGRMVSLLGVAVREDRLLCVESQKDGNFKRSGLRKLEYDPYTADMQKVISAYIKMVDAALKGRNLTGVPDDYYPR
ncbi:WSC domain-containing protein 2 isoform X2 [Mustela erminea]|uniref:WSC domain-containing protein 2 isoform X2 n=1 Tax=Mustela erminea TaxID=36723 RepID=UPI0013867896|nr:WSC domain-containing protein 2 isoform X2 [Mustela erminea]